MLPTWAGLVIGIAALIIAIGTIWTKGLRPLWRVARRAEVMIPLLIELTETFKNTPHAFQVLDEIQAQFRTDSGSSLRDVVNRLDRAAVANAASTSALQIVVTEVLGKATLSAQAADEVAAKLAVAQQAVEGVAADLADSHKRADETHPSEPAGAAADAALRQSETDHAIQADKA